MPSPCTVAQAMSALVKMVRLRRTEDAIYWYNHLCVHFHNDSFRLHRRLLILSAEDCIEVPVQSMVYDWYKKALSKKYDKTDFLASYLIAVICSTENWWQQDNGNSYILHWRLAEKRFRSTEHSPTANPLEAFELMQDAILDGNSLEACYQHMRFINLKGNRIEEAKWLRDTAVSLFNLSARMVAQVHLTHGRMLSFDDNWLGQAVYRLSGRSLGGKGFTEPSNEYVIHLIQKSIQEATEAPRTPPPWTQDGIHCSGKDTRFAGLLSSMVGCCNMYHRHGVLDPNHPWDDTSRSTEALASYLETRHV